MKILTGFTYWFKADSSNSEGDDFTKRWYGEAKVNANLSVSHLNYNNLLSYCSGQALEYD